MNGGLPKESDASLVARCKRGEGAAWRVLVQRYQRLVYTVVRRAGSDEHAAADVFQTVFSRLLVHLERIANPDGLQAWIVTTTKREALAQRARDRRHVSLTPTGGDEDAAAAWDFPDDALLPEEALAEIQQTVQVRDALERLDPRCRTLLGMLFAEDAPGYDEVAARLGTPVGSIGPTRARCLAKLRTLLR